MDLDLWQLEGLADRMMVRSVEGRRYNIGAAWRDVRDSAGAAAVRLGQPLRKGLGADDDLDRKALLHVIAGRLGSMLQSPHRERFKADFALEKDPADASARPSAARWRRTIEELQNLLTELQNLISAQGPNDAELPIDDDGDPRDRPREDQSEILERYQRPR